MGGMLRAATLIGFIHPFGIATLAGFKDAAQGAQALFTSIAIIVGAWWSWSLFIRRRERYPRAKVTHQAVYWPIAANHVLLRVVVDIANNSTVLLSPGEGKILIQQVRPLIAELHSAIVRGDDPVSSDAAESPTRSRAFNGPVAVPCRQHR